MEFSVKLASNAVPQVLLIMIPVLGIMGGSFDYSPNDIAHVQGEVTIQKFNSDGELVDFMHKINNGYEFKDKSSYDQYKKIQNFVP